VKEHKSIVNSCMPGNRGSHLLVTGSDDNTVKLFDIRIKHSQATFDAEYSVCAVTFNSDNNQIFSAGIDNVIKVWDLRRQSMLFSLEGHTDTVTGLSLSPDGNFLLSNSMDNSLRSWDIRPFSAGDRCTAIYTGHQHSFEKNLLRCSWSPDGSRISAGSADRFVYVWDVVSRRVLFKLPGHSGSVNEVAFHPKEPIIASASSDKKIYMGELL